MYKCHLDHQDFQLALPNWPNTLTAGMDSSLAQRFFRWRTKTLLTTKANLLHQTYDTTLASQKLKNKQQKSEYYYNRTVKYQPALKEKDTVRIQPSILEQK